MKYAGIAVLAAVSFLGACSESPDPGSAEAAAVAPATPQAARPLGPEYQAALDCLEHCSSIWSVRAENAVAAEKPLLPTDFAKLLATPADLNRFQHLVKQFPQPLWPMGLLQPEDHDAPKAPELFGNLVAVLRRPAGDVYFYSGVYLFRIKDLVDGNMTVAVDPKTREMAALAKSGSALTDYYIAGASQLRGALLAYAAAYDLESAASALHYAQHGSTAGPYEMQPIQFPLRAKLAAAQARVTLFSERLGPTGRASAVPPPPEGQLAGQVKQGRTWYAVAQGRDKCVISPMSPAERLDVINSAGLTPSIQETKLDNRITAVAITVTEGGRESIWRFWKSAADCENALAYTLVPNSYR